ncbi:MAG: hypothetical protein U0736_07365 [Gemmataceae bacterium]
MVRVGERVPDVELTDAAGVTHRLSQLHAGPVVLVFLRHLG